MLVADHFPKLGTDLVPALASLNVKDFSHCCLLENEMKKQRVFFFFFFFSLFGREMRGFGEGEEVKKVIII